MSSSLENIASVLRCMLCDTQDSYNFPNDDITSYRKIGFGFTGLVFEAGPTYALKVARKPDYDSLWNDYLVHTKVYESFKSAREIEVRVPTPNGYVNSGLEGESKRWWAINGTKFPPDSEMPIPSDLIIMQRIPPVPRIVRRALIDLYVYLTSHNLANNNRFCPRQLKARALQDDTNRDCLIRVYLGSRRVNPSVESTKTFSLRNFNLHLNQIEEIGVDPRKWAVQMGRVLAILHWEARVDAHDVELVLGSVPRGERSSLRYEEISRLPPRTCTVVLQPDSRPSMDMWLLDFNNVTMIEGTKADIDHLVWAFFWNDPYFPLPEAELPKDQELWKAFSQAYLDKSTSILALQPGRKELPRMFLDASVERERKNMASGLGRGWREPR